MAAFEEGAVGLLAPLQAAITWLCNTPKLHALAHHASTFLRRFGSIGSHKEKALEVWHGRFNHTLAHFRLIHIWGRASNL